MATLRPAVWLAATKIGSEVAYAFGHFLFSNHSLIQESLDRLPVGPLMSAEALRLKILRQVLCRWLEIGSTFAYRPLGVGRRLPIILLPRGVSLP